MLSVIESPVDSMARMPAPAASVIVVRRMRPAERSSARPVPALPVIVQSSIETLAAFGQMHQAGDVVGEGLAGAVDGEAGERYQLRARRR